MRSTVRRGALAIRFVPLVLVVTCALRGHATPPTETTHLGALASVLLNGQRTTQELRGHPNAPRMTQPAHSAMDFVLRLPEGAELLLHAARPFDPADFAIVVDTDDGLHLEPELVAIPSGDALRFRASLADAGGTIARLSFRNRAPRKILWVEARVTGRGRPAPEPMLAPPAARDRPLNVVLYVIDTLRADHLNSYGYDLPTSRKLERLAARGLMFRSAYASGSSTATSIPTLLASRFPSELSGRLAADGPAELTLSEAFQRAGYQTVGYQANFALLAELGYSRGFDDYHVLKVRREGSWRYRRAAEIHDECRRFLERRDARPFFLYVQTMDVHVPHDPHPRFKDRVHPAIPRTDAVPAGIDLDPTALATFSLFMDALDRKAYDEEVAYATHEFVRFYGMLRRFDLLEDTLVVLTADHGEPLGEHGHAMHGLALYEEQVHVPLMLWMPGYPPGERAGIVSLLDLAPTILDLAGLPIPSSFRGQSWAGSPSQIALGERVKTTSRVPVGAFVRHGPWKLITGPQGQELYDLRIDPDEATNVRDAYPILTEYLIQELIAHIPYHRGLGRKPVRFDAGLSPRAQRELHESLRALGYLE